MAATPSATTAPSPETAPPSTLVPPADLLPETHDVPDMVPAPESAHGIRSVDEAVVEVMKKIGYIKKIKSQDSGIKYPFLAEENLIPAVNAACAEVGVTVTPIKMRVQFSESYKTSGGSSWRFIRLVVTYEFKHAYSGTTKRVVAIGEGADSGDKAAYKAQTGALKYALRQGFLVASGKEEPIGNTDPDRTPSERMTKTDKSDDKRNGSGKKKELSPEERQRINEAKRLYLRRLARIKEAATEAELSEYQAKYRQDGKNTQAQVAELDKAAQARRTQLTAPSAETKPG